MHIPTLLPAFLLLLATANASAVFPRNGGENNQGSGNGDGQGQDNGKGLGSGPPSEYCPSVSSDCYHAVSSHRRMNSGFCGDFKSKKGRNMPDDMRDYSQDDVNNACDCGQSPAPQCSSVSVSCYDDVKSHRDGDSGFCRVFNSPQSCDLQDDLRRYSRSDVSSACYCLEPAPSQSPPPRGPPQNPSPQCPSSSNDCYNEVKSRRERDDGFCGRCKDKDSCDKPSDMTGYERGDMSNACDCLEPGRNNPSPQCPASSDNCYRDVKSRRDRDSEFCSRCRDKDNCDRSDELSMYSRGDMSKACDCLEPGRNNPSPQCPAVSDNCYRDVKSRRERDTEYCGRCRDKDNCDRPDELSRYSGDDVSKACGCMPPPNNGPPNGGPPNNMPPSTQGQSTNHQSSPHSSNTQTTNRGTPSTQTSARMSQTQTTARTSSTQTSHRAASTQTSTNRSSSTRSQSQSQSRSSSMHTSTRSPSPCTTHHSQSASSTREATATMTTRY